MNYERFYTELGRLLYTIAKADGNIQHPEIQELKRIVKDELLEIEGSTDDFDTDAAYATEFEFEVLEDWDLPADETFAYFKSYIQRTPSLPVPLKKLAYRCAMKVAGSYRGITDKETGMLEELKQVLRAG